MIESLVASASSYSGDIDNLFLQIFVVVGFWFILVEGILFYFIFRFRRKEGVKAQYITGDEKHQAKWIHLPHYAVIACDVVLIAFTMFLWIEIKQDLPEAEDKVKVIAQQWSWKFIHSGPDGVLDTADDIVTFNELYVKVNTVYHFELQSIDVIHDLSIPVFRLKQDAVPGRIITGWFEPTKTGNYDIQCAEICGVYHGLMRAVIKIQSPESYSRWMESMSLDKEETIAENTFPTPDIQTSPEVL